MKDGERSLLDRQRVDRDYRFEGQKTCRLSRWRRERLQALARLPASWLPCRMELGRINMGLPLSWLTFQADRRSDRRPG